MCRNIKTLFNFEPPATDEEIHASALQFVRKLSGFHTPSAANEAAFTHAVEQVSAAARQLIDDAVGIGERPPAASPVIIERMDAARALAMSLEG